MAFCWNRIGGPPGVSSLQQANMLGWLAFQACTDKNVSLPSWKQILHFAVENKNCTSLSDIFGNFSLNNVELSYTALSGIYLLLVTMQQVLRWEYGWTTMVDETTQNKSLVNIFIILKKIKKNYIYVRPLFVFSIHFVIWPILVGPRHT